MCRSKNRKTKWTISATFHLTAITKEADNVTISFVAYRRLLWSLTFFNLNKFLLYKENNSRNLAVGKHVWKTPVVVRKWSGEWLVFRDLSHSPTAPSCAESRESKGHKVQQELWAAFCLRAADFQVIKFQTCMKSHPGILSRPLFAPRLECAGLKPESSAHRCLTLQTWLPPLRSRTC